MQPDDESTIVNVQARVTEPFVAFTVTVSPEERPRTVTKGVGSFVMLSQLDTPVSDEGTRSGASTADPVGGMVVVVVVVDVGFFLGAVPLVAGLTSGGTDVVVVVVVVTATVVAGIPPGFVDPKGFEVSIVRVSDADGADVLPRESAEAAVTDHTPSVRAGRSQPETVPDATNVHVAVFVPFVAVTVTASPATAPGTSTLGVVTDVTLSLFDFPVSLTVARSGIPGTGGGVESTTIDSAGPATEMFPAGSVSVAVTVHVPSGIAAKSQLLAEPTVYEHVAEVVPFVPVSVTMSPVEPPAAESVGVVSAVTLSPSDGPVSDAESRSGVAGAVGGVESMTRGSAFCVAPTFPATSMMEADTDQVPSERVGRSHEDATPAT